MDRVLLPWGPVSLRRLNDFDPSLVPSQLRDAYPAFDDSHWVEMLALMLVSSEIASFGTADSIALTHFILDGFCDLARFYHLADIGVLPNRDLVVPYLQASHLIGGSPLEVLDEMFVEWPDIHVQQLVERPIACSDPAVHHLVRPNGAAYGAIAPSALV